MSDYYTFTPIAGFSLARSSEVNDRFTQVDTAFGTLPPAALLREARATYAVATGTANALVAALPKTLTAYTAGLSVAIKAALTNTGPATINIDGLGAVAITRSNLEPLAAGDILAGTVLDLRYDGTAFRMMAAVNYVIQGDAAGTVVTLSGTQTITGAKTFSGATTFAQFSCTGNATIGDAVGDSHTVNGSFTINHQLVSVGNPVVGNANPALQLYNAALTDRFAVISHGGLGNNLAIVNEEAGSLVLGTNGFSPILIQADGVVRLQRSAPELDLFNADGSNRLGYILHNGPNTHLDIVNEEAGNLRFTTNGVNTATISSTGLAVTGTLSTTGNATLGDATSDTHIVNGALSVRMGAGADYAAITIFENGTPQGVIGSYATSGYCFTATNSSGVIRFGVKAATGELYTATPSTTASAANVYHSGGAETALLRSTSSVRYKQGIEPIDPARAMRTLDAEVIWFRPNIETCPADNPAFSHYGVKAEQLATVEKRLVHWIAKPDDYNLPVEPSWPKLADGTQLVPDGAQYERLNLLRTEALKIQVKELKAVNETLKADNAALKADNEGLKTQFFDLMVRVKALEDAAA